ncbi:MAG: S26 family signal peptidase [Candidatus Methanomethylophilaceae archaeon]|nr:S26 family signal peptidase [Candidatus Methanomethylophilaceae archaeon]
MFGRDREVGRGFYIKVGLVLLLVLASVYLVYDLNGSSLDLSDREVRLIVTDSMDGGPTDYPISTIPKDSLVMIEHLDDAGLDGLSVGDVLAFKSLGLLFTHRIIAVDRENRVFTTQGDNAAAPETVPYSNAIGKVVGVNHWMGQAVTFLKQYGILVGALVLLAVVGYEAIRWILRHGEENSTG